MAGFGRDPSVGDQASHRQSFLLWITTAVIIGSVLALYAWTLHEPSAFSLNERRSDYYSLQVHGWAKGNLALDVTPHPDLRVEFPNRITQEAPYLLDASYYQGRYYLYFGPVPALVLMLPYHLLTGHDLSESFAAFLFTATGFLLSIAWLWLILTNSPRLVAGRRWFPFAILALGLANAAPTTLTRPLFYEVAIGSGYAFTQASLLAIVLAFRHPARAMRWLALAGCFAGLAGGSRPNLLIGAAVVLPLSALMLWQRSDRSLRSAIRHLAAAGLPVALATVALLAYNHARFDRWFEFGNTLQLGANPQGFGFTLASFWHNLKLYYFIPPAFDWYFPFVAPGSEPPRPAGYFGVEELHGQFLLMPAILTALAVSLLALRRQLVAPSAKGSLPAVIALGSLANFALVASTGVRANRYLLDFQPALVALIVIVMVAMIAKKAPLARWLGRFLALSLLLNSLHQGLASLQAGRRFRLQDPAAYTAIETVANRLAAPLSQAFTLDPGGQRFHITFPLDASHRVEPLIVAGFSSGHDALLIEFLSTGLARLVFDHHPHGPVHGPEFTYTPGAAAELCVQLGTLYPPVGHPWYGDLSLERQQVLRHRVAVWLDDKPILQAHSITHATSLAQTRLGQRWFYAQGAARFTGRLEHRGADAAPLLTASDAPQEIVVRLPNGLMGHREPILTYGSPSARIGDAIFVEYREAGLIRFGYDAGGQLAFSPDVQIDPAALHRLTINVSAGARAGNQPGRIQLALDDDIVWSAPFWNRAIPDGVWIPFANPDLSTTCRSQFTGVIHGSMPAIARIPLDAPSRYVIPSFALRAPGPSPDTVTAIAAWTQAGGEQASLGVEDTGDGSLRVTWQESGTEAGASLVWPAERLARLTLVPLAEDGFVLIHGSDVVMRQRTDFFLRGTPSFWVGGESPTAGVFRPHARMILRPELSREKADDRTSAAEEGARLAVVLPRNKAGMSEPLLVAGVSGRADAVYVRYVDNSHIIFGFDHWGGPGAESPPIPVDYDEVLDLELAFTRQPSGESARASMLQIRLGGTVVWNTPVALHGPSSDGWVVGVNMVGLSTSNTRFTGVVEKLRPGP